MGTVTTKSRRVLLHISMQSCCCGRRTGRNIGSRYPGFIIHNPLLRLYQYILTHEPALTVFDIGRVSAIRSRPNWERIESK